VTVGIYSDRHCSVAASKIVYKNDPDLCQPVAFGFAKGSCKNVQVGKNLQVIVKCEKFCSLCKSILKDFQSCYT
jgi:hypothetical protein